MKNAAYIYPEVINVYFELSEKPGWGIEINEDFINDNPPEKYKEITLDPGLNMFENPNWAQRGQSK